MLNKKVYIFAFFCIYNAQLFSMGKNDKVILSVPIEFTGMNIELGGRISKDLLEKFGYDNSINKYYYEITDGNYLFKKVYLGIKRNKIIDILLESDLYSSEEMSKGCISELVLELCRQKYGIEHTVKKTPRFPLNETSSLDIILNNLERKIWNIENIQILYLHLPKDAFERIYEGIKDGHDIWYYIEYSITKS
jgi:hypothetical protein